MVCNEDNAEKLIGWFLENSRYMPWREDPTPYHVWVSEIMLQQTRVDTVMPYYRRFIEALPDVEALASCEEDRLMKLWEGLGYYSRVRNLQKAAKICVEKYGGNVPDTYEELLKLPGIGSYTAGAVASIAYRRKTPVVDGNVLRVLSRLTGSRKDIRDPQTKRMMEEELFHFLEDTEPDPSAFNQGLMELGAIVCLPNGEPKCFACPWKDSCVSHLEGLTDVIPVASPKNAQKNVDLTALILVCGNRAGIKKRGGKGLLSGLYGLPLLEGHLSEEEVREKLTKKGADPSDIRKLPSGRHVFTHLIWDMTAYRVETKDPVPGFLYVTADELADQYALPGAFKKWNIKDLIDHS